MTEEQSSFIGRPDREGNVTFRHNFEFITPEYFRSSVDKLVDTCEGKIIVTAHMGPDDDAIFSALAFKRQLEDTHPGKDVQLVMSEKTIHMWDNFAEPGEIIWAASQKVQEGDKNRDGDLMDYVQEGDLIIALDQGEPGFFSKQKDKWLNRQGIKAVVLDHHDARNPNTDEGWITNATSTAELLTRIYKPEEISPEVAALLYLGMSGDTRNFSFKPDYGQVKVTADSLLAKAGASYQELRGKIIKEPSAQKYEQAYKQHMKVVEPPNDALPKITYSFISAEENQPIPGTENPSFHQFITRRDVMYDMSQSDPEGLMLTVVKLPSGDKYSVMMRRGNNNKFDLNQYAKEFGRGGAPGAATIDISPNEEQIKQEMAENNLDTSEEAVASLVTKMLYKKLQG